MTGWFKVAEIKDKSALETSKVLDQVWFCLYPQPLGCITDNGCKLLGTEFKELLRSTFNLKLNSKEGYNNNNFIIIVIIILYYLIIVIIVIIIYLKI